MTKKVAILSGLTYPVPPVRGGGPQIVLYNTCLNLTDPEIDWYILASWEPELDEINYDHSRIKAVKTIWLDKLILKCVNFLPYRLRKSIFSEVGDQKRLLLNIKIIRKLIFRAKDIIVCHESYSLTYLVYLFFPRKKIISYIHNSKVHIDFSEDMWERLVRASTAGIIMGAEAARNDVRLKFSSPPVNSWVIYNGVNIDKFNSNKKGYFRDQMRGEFNLLEEDFVFLYCGRIAAIKKLENIISSFLVLAGEIENVKLVIVGSASKDDYGDSSYESKLHQMIPEDQKEKVIFTGFYPPEVLLKIYSIADCGILATVLSETITLFLLECMACGIPVITTDVGGIPEVVRNDQEGIVISRNYSGDDLTAAMRQMVLNKEEWAAKSNKIEKYIQANFSWARVAEEFASILHEV